METKKREFIDPNDLMKYIEENHCYAGLPMAAHICTMELLTYAPRVDVVEVVHGHWIHKNTCGPHTAKFHCSVCDKIPRSLCPEDYCPNCGARMDGGE